ncbi:hypothetical protein RRG08_005495 [Elysia crispata]|uniref:Uncharacterized protein n=1 Tax=Elysia crispata TaxID=231223 RepID=A0AAE0Y0X3_9GAST|nr:hypothetical protein RRG08_005495 [Elysia crispata]
MQKGSNRDSSKRTGLSVRYCFDGLEKESQPDSGPPEDAQDVSAAEPCQESALCPMECSHAGLMVGRRAPPHLQRSSHWFQAGLGSEMKRRARLSSAGARRQAYTLSDETDRHGGVWRGDGDEDPGFFVTSKVKQPPKEDTLSWDSSCSSSSSEDDVGNVYSKDWRSGNNNYLWGSRRIPIPPSGQDISSNKGFDDTNFRGSTVATSGGHSNKRVENTFRLEPKPGQAFVWFKARRPIVSVVDQLLDEFVYNQKSAPAVTRKLCEVIMKMIKKHFDWPRYKFVCNVTLVQLRQQGIMIADRALWNTAVDNVASYAYKNKFVVCVVTFHALYCE